jgi:hypothetical protein
MGGFFLEKRDHLTLKNDLKAVFYLNGSFPLEKWSYLTQKWVI